jgi:hypothetical protein
LYGNLDLQNFDLLMFQKLFMSRSDKFEDQYEGHLANLLEEIKKLSIDNPDFMIL